MSCAKTLYIYKLLFYTYKNDIAKLKSRAFPVSIDTKYLQVQAEFSQKSAAT